MLRRFRTPSQIRRSRVRWTSQMSLAPSGARSFCILSAEHFKGDIHLGPQCRPIDGRPVLEESAGLPEGVDLAVFTLAAPVCATPSRPA